MIMENFRLPNEISSAFGKRAPMFQVPSAVIMDQIDREGTSYYVFNASYELYLVPRNF